MKKITFVLSFLILIPCLVWAAAGSWGTPSPVLPNNASAFKTWSITFTASADNATIPNYTTTTTDQNFMKGYWIFGVETDPGSTGPTDNYDVVINNAASRDIMGGALSNRDSSTTEFAMALAADGVTKYSPPVDGALTIAVSGNSVNSATSSIKLYLFR
jgi:hypothetical protein